MTLQRTMSASKKCPHDPNQRRFESYLSNEKQTLKAPILGYPDFYSRNPFIVTTYASFVGLIYIISEGQKKNEQILGHGNRKLSNAESKYHIDKLELLSVVTCIKKNKFLQYHKFFVLRGNNKSLCYMKNLSSQGRLGER